MPKLDEPQMSFFRWVSERLLGPPSHERNGDAHWPCPKCGDPAKYHQLAAHPKFTSRGVCTRCGLLADECDLAGLLGRKVPPSEWERWRQAHAAGEPPPRPAQAKGPGVTSGPTRGPFFPPPRARPLPDAADLDAVWADLDEDEQAE